jgi:hypothetical protein
MERTVDEKRVGHSTHNSDDQLSAKVTIANARRSDTPTRGALRSIRRMALSFPKTFPQIAFRLSSRLKTERLTGTFGHSGPGMMLARPVAMVIFDDKRGTRSRRIYWHDVQ